MRPLQIRSSSRTLPGGAPVSEHSLFTPVAGARSIEADPVPATGTVAPGLPRHSLAGSWKRLPLDSDPATVGELPDPAGPEWRDVRVPNNFGLEPNLSEHFGPVYYARRLPAVGSERCRLVFDAADYLCDAWLDGEHLGRHEGYFAPFAFDVTGRVSDGSVLLVRVQDPFEDLASDQFFMQHAKRVIKGTLKYHDSRPGGLPGSATPGWNARLGQSMTTGGITADLRLEGSGPVRIDAMFTTPLDQQSGEVHLALILTNDASDDKQVLIHLDLKPPAGVSTQGALRASVSPGASRIDLELTVPDPQAWWPCSHADLGSPALYDLRAALLVDGRLSDDRTTRFGLRTARLVSDPKRFELNGRTVFLQALNYIPRQHFAEVDREFYHNDYRLCKELHMNSLGVHGHVQCRPCYQAADEAGLLIFQDFALQWHYDSGTQTNPGFIDLACGQIADMAYTLYNHPSVVYWCCHNEPNALFLPGMQPDPASDPDNQVLDEALEVRLRSVDPSRHIHRASGIGDDFHLYDGSLNGGSVYGVRDRQTWFVSEYGFWTAGPRCSEWGDTGWPPDESLTRQWLSRMSFGPATYNFTGLQERYPSMQAWSRATEAYGDFLARYQTEWIRINRSNPFFAYRWHFFSDWWGYAGGGLVDVDRRPKATFHALSQATRPVLVATSLPHTIFEPGTVLKFPIHLINETREHKDLTVEWSWHPVDESLVIGVDEEVATRFPWPALPEPGSMVAMPADLPGHSPMDPRTAAKTGSLPARAEPESSNLIGTVEVQVPDTPLCGATLELRWAGSETNHYHVLAADPGWFCGPGAFLVGPSGSSRLDIHKSG